MYNLIWLFALLLITSNAVGQEPQFSLQRSLPQEANAAFTGSGDANRLVVGSHYRPFSKSYYLLSNYIGYDQYVNKLHGGLGIELKQVFYGSSYVFGFNRIMLNYAFHQNISKNLKISAGVGAGFSYLYQNFVFMDDFGTVVTDTTFRQLNFKYKAGLIVHAKSFYVGAYYMLGTNLVNQPLMQENNLFKVCIGGDLTPFKNKNLTLSPSLFFSRQNGFQQLDFQLAFATNRFALGMNATERSIGFFGGIFFDKIAMKYQFMSYLSQLSLNTGQSHEFVFSYKFNNTSGDKNAFFSPKQF